MLRQAIGIVTISFLMFAACGPKEPQAPAGQTEPAVEAPAVLPADDESAFQRAEAYLAAHPDDLATAAKLFEETAHSYPDSEWGRKAEAQHQALQDKQAAAVYLSAAADADLILNAGGDINDALKGLMEVTARFKDSEYGAKAADKIAELCSRTIKISLQQSPGDNLLNLKLGADVASSVAPERFDREWVIGDVKLDGSPAWVRYTFPEPGFYEVRFTISFMGRIAASSTLQVDLSLDHCLRVTRQIIKDAEPLVLAGQYDKALASLQPAGICPIPQVRKLVSEARQDIQTITGQRDALIKSITALHRNRNYDDIVNVLNTALADTGPDTLWAAILKLELAKTDQVAGILRSLPASVRASAGKEVRLGGIKGTIVRYGDNAIELEMLGQTMNVNLDRLTPDELLDLILQYGTRQTSAEEDLGLSCLMERSGAFDAAANRLESAAAKGLEKAAFCRQLLAYNRGIEAGAASRPDRQVDSTQLTEQKDAEEAREQADIKEGKLRVKRSSLERNLARVVRTIGNVRLELTKYTAEVSKREELLKKLRSDRDMYERNYLGGYERHYDDFKRLDKEVTALEQEIEVFKQKIELCNRKIQEGEAEQRTIEAELARLP